MSSYTTYTKVKLQNKISAIEVDLHGGAITDFHLHDNPVNPLSFRFSKEQMPANNKRGAAYQGHFLCAGRWGEPSAGEIKAGIPNHGEAANIDWNIIENNEWLLCMETTATMEGLHINKVMNLDESNAICHVTETITNINPLGRLYQMVQHPTVAAPFLNEATIINCNATTGFNYDFVSEPDKYKVYWPLVNGEHNNLFDLRNPRQHYNSVYSFITDKNDAYSWITAYSPADQLVLGYIWPRKDYPWINLWQHFENNAIKYRGLEFGNTGLHQPFKKIIAGNNLELFGEQIVSYIDADESSTREYAFFLYNADSSFKGAEKLTIKDNTLFLEESITGKAFNIGTVQFKSDHEK